jgi:hypothetical protein
MNVVNRAKAVCYQGTKSTLAVTTTVVSKTEPLEKAAKIAYRSFEFYQTLFKKISSPLAVLSVRLKDCSEMFETFQFIGRFNELIGPGPNGKSFFQISTWQKIADRIFLTIHCTLKSMIFFDKTKLISLGTITTTTIGRVPIFKLVSDSFCIISNAFGIWDNINKVHKGNHEVNITHVKMEKWKSRPKLLAKVQNGDSLEITQLKKKYEEKSAAINLQVQILEKKLQKTKDLIRMLDEVPRDVSLLPNGFTEQEQSFKYKEKIRTLEAKMSALQVKQKKYAERLLKINTENYEGLTHDLMAQQNITGKLRKWEVKRDDVKAGFLKIWIGIANNVGKIAVITLALGLTALNLWSAPYLLTLLGLSVIVDAIGLTKILYDEHHQAAPKRTLVAAAA